MSTYINKFWTDEHITCIFALDACIAAIRIYVVLCRSVMGFTPQWKTRCPCTTLQRNSLSLICQTKMPICTITRVGLIFRHLLLSWPYCLRFQLLHNSASTCDMYRQYWIMLKEYFVSWVHKFINIWIVENSTSPEFKPAVYDNKENFDIELPPRHPPSPSPPVGNLPDAPPPRFKEPAKSVEDPFDLGNLL